MPKIISVIDLAYGSFAWFVLVICGGSPLAALLERTADSTRA